MTSPINTYRSMRRMDRGIRACNECTEGKHVGPAAIAGGFIGAFIPPFGAWIIPGAIIGMLVAFAIDSAKESRQNERRNASR